MHDWNLLCVFAFLLLSFSDIWNSGRGHRNRLRRPYSLRSRFWHLLFRILPSGSHVAHKRRGHLNSGNKSMVRVSACHLAHFKLTGFCRLYRKEVRAVSTRKSKSSLVEKILIVCTESGILYCLIWVSIPRSSVNPLSFTSNIDSVLGQSPISECRYAEICDHRLHGSCSIRAHIIFFHDE